MRCAYPTQNRHRITRCCASRRYGARRGQVSLHSPPCSRAPLPVKHHLPVKHVARSAIHPTRALVQSLGVRLDHVGDARPRQRERQRRSVL
eukprot:7382889-Prymnesium_polylepis.1